MCMGSGPRIPPPPPPVAPPPPPPQITIQAPPQIAGSMMERMEQLRPDNPVRRRRQRTTKRGKGMLKIPMNTSQSGVNV